MENTLIKITLADYLKLGGSLELLNNALKEKKIKCTYLLTYSLSKYNSKLYDVSEISEQYISDKFSKRSQNSSSPIMERTILLSNFHTIKTLFDSSIHVFMPVLLPKEFYKE